MYLIKEQRVHICIKRLQFKIWDHDNLREDDKAGLTWVELNDYVSHGQVLTLNLNKKGYDYDIRF
jgi:hypothetical protein